MDRALDPKGPSPYRSQVSQNNETPYGMYDYLREDLSIVISSLYKVERDWAIPFFETGNRPISENDEQWHRGLAKLGATMHAVQDFFAHTTFVEHAIRGDWDRRTSSLNWRQKALIFKRLHRWEHQPRVGKRRSWRDFPEETHIVSGYFDCMDTAVVFLHIAFDFLGEVDDVLESEDLERVMSDMKETADRVISDPWGEAKKKLNEVVEIIEDPKKALADVTNETAQEHRELLERPPPPTKFDPNLTRDLLADSHLFRDAADKEVLEHAIKAVQFLHFIVSGGQLLYRYFRLAKDIVDLIIFGIKLKKTPMLVLRDLPEEIGEKLALYLRKVIVHETERAFLWIIGSERLGSHSLISKDEDAALLSKEALELAKFVDAYIISLMVRAPFDPEDHRFKSPRKVHLTKWEDVIGHFLNHPYASYEVKTSKTERLLDDFSIHIDTRRQPNSLLTL